MNEGAVYTSKACVVQDTSEPVKPHINGILKPNIHCESSKWGDQAAVDIYMRNVY